jgi:hypothetical protein
MIRQRAAFTEVMSDVPKNIPKDKQPWPFPLSILQEEGKHVKLYPWSFVISVIVLSGVLTWAAYGIILKNKEGKIELLEAKIKILEDENTLSDKDHKSNGPKRSTPEATSTQGQTLTVNATNGIGIGGNNYGNPQVHNFGPPPANLTFNEKISQPLINGKKQMEVRIRTDRAIPGAVIAIIFSSDIDVEYFKEHNPVLDTGPNGASSLTWGGPVSKNGQQIPNSIFINIGLPSAFRPENELIIYLQSSSDVHVQELGVIQ